MAISPTTTVPTNSPSAVIPEYPESPAVVPKPTRTPTSSTSETTATLPNSPSTVIPEIYTLDPNELNLLKLPTIDPTVPLVSPPILSNPLADSLSLKSHSGTCF